ncbi:MAG: outer membrane protein transport protein [Polyangiaceae bacterium]|nr:outer membrane protein transport protein [Polyangiaceae bacterium]
MRRLGLALGVVFGCGALSPGEALASGISVARFGGEHGHPTTTNATAIFYNPAGIGMSDGTHLFADVSLAWRKTTYKHDLVGTDDGTVPGANDGTGKLFNVLASPMLGVTTKIGDLALGAGFYVPYGGQSVWDKNDKFEDDPQYAGPVDGVQRWYVMEGIIRSSFVTLAGAYHIKPARLSVGVSGNLIFTTVDTVRAKTPSGNNQVSAEGRAYLHATGTDWSLGVGALYEAMPKQLWVGASYQSRPNLTGMKKLEGNQRTLLVNADGTYSDGDVPASMEHELPDVIRLGGRYRPADDMEIRLFGDYTRWSVLERHIVKNTDKDSFLLDQERSWKDTFGVRAGFSKWVTQPLEVYGGAGFSSNAVPDSTLEPALPDWDALSFTAGGRYELVKDLFGSLSYTQLVYLPRDTNGKNTLTEPNPSGAVPNPDAGGKYKQAVGVVNLNVDFAF